MTVGSLRSVLSKIVNFYLPELKFKIARVGLESSHHHARAPSFITHLSSQLADTQTVKCNALVTAFRAPISWSQYKPGLPKSCASCWLAVLMTEKSARLCAALCNVAVTLL